MSFGFFCTILWTNLYELSGRPNIYQYITWRRTYLGHFPIFSHVKLNDLIISFWCLIGIHYGLPWWLSSKESTCQCRRHRFDPWVGKIPWRRKWQPTPVFLPGESHGQRSLGGYSPWGHKELDMTEQLTLSHLKFYIYLLFFRFFFHIRHYRVLSSEQRRYFEERLLTIVGEWVSTDKLYPVSSRTPCLGLHSWLNFCWNGISVCQSY